MGTRRMRVIVCGSRDWTAVGPIRAALEALPADAIVIEGGAKGADRIARHQAESLGLQVETHPADWAKYGRGAGPVRNQQMLDSGADLVLAFPLPSSKGTFHMMQLAREAGVRVVDGYEAILKGVQGGQDT